MTILSGCAVGNNDSKEPSDPHANLPDFTNQSVTDPDKENVSIYNENPGNNDKDPNNNDPSQGDDQNSDSSDSDKPSDINGTSEPDETITEYNGTSAEDIIYQNRDYFGKYKNTGDTDLAITDVTVFNSSASGTDTILAAKSGDSLIFNLLCNPDATEKSAIYLVKEDTEHKDKYVYTDYEEEYLMFTAVKMSDNSAFIDVTIPTGLTPGIYEFRFVNGTEEGFIPLYIQ